MHRLLLVFLFLGIFTVGSTLAQSGLSETELSALLQDYGQADEPGIVVFVDAAGQTASAAFGLADIAAGTPISIADSFRIASASKPFVAVAVLMLVDKGEIDLDEPIAAYLPADLIAGIRNADSATVRQMLQMSSGIASYTDSDRFDAAVQQAPSYPWTAAEVLAFVRDDAALFAPGTDYYYSNTNYILAELLIEAVAEQSLAQALQAWIFAPLGMETCYLETAERFAQGIARGYLIGDNGDFEDITTENDGVGLGDGGIVCTAADLAKFLPALLNGDLLEEDTLEAMLTTVSDGEDGEYGLGIAILDSDFGEIIFHDGASSGFQSIMMTLPDEAITVVVLTNNFDAEFVEDIALDAFDLALGE